MRKLLLVAPLLLALTITSSTTAPAQEHADLEHNLNVLTSADVALWQAWIRADLPTVYSLAQEMQGRADTDVSRLWIARHLQRTAADELGWQETHRKDLEARLQDEPRDALARFELIRRLIHQGRLDELEPHRRKLGILSDWWIAGPFPNERGQGFEDDQEPEADFHPRTEYIGKDGQLVNWRKVPGPAPDGTIHIGAMMRPARESVAYLMTAFHVDANTVGVLRLGSDQPVKAMLMDRNGPYFHILHSDAERPLGFDQSSSHYFTLHAGWNVLMLKAGNGEGDWQLRARMLASQPYRVAADAEELGTAVESLETRSRPGLDLAEMPSYLQDAILALLAPSQDNSSGHTRAELNRALRELESRADATAAERAVLCYLTAWANRSSAAVAAGREENRRRELLQECLRHDPSAARAKLELSQYYTAVYSNPTLANRYALDAVALAPAWPEARLYAARVAAMKGLNVEVDRELHALVREFPEHPAVLRFAGYYAGQRRQMAYSNDLFERALKVVFSDQYSRERLLERAAHRGDIAAAEKYAADALRVNPFDIEPHKILLELYLGAGEFERAYESGRNALVVAPRDDDVLAKLGGVLTAWAEIADSPDQAERRRARAADYYRAALDANPNRDDIERYLEFLDGGAPPFETALQEDITERLQRVVDAGEDAVLDSDNAYEVLFREQIVVVNEDGTTHTYTQEAYRVTNDAGREMLRVIRTPMWSDQQGRCVHAEVWRADGWREEARRSRWSATFPPLDVGDIVHVRFRVSDTEQSFFGDFYGTREVLADYVPVRELRLHWVLPPGREFYEYRTGNAPERSEREVEGRRVWSYVAHNIPRLIDEPIAPPAHQRAATVQISTWGDWRAFGRWYYNLIRRQLEPTPEMTAQVESLIAGLDDEREKARAVYEWVVRNIRYNADWHFGVHGYKPFSAGAVFARRIGDCKDKAIVICAMLAIAGVNAYPVIINLEEFRGHEDITLPIPDHFNHAIAYIEYSDGTGQFVDGTTTYHGFDELPSADAGAEVIIVRPDGGERVKVPTPKPGTDRTETDMRGTLRPNGTLRLEVTRRGYGDSASDIRARYQRRGDIRQRLESEWSRYYPGARVVDFDTNDLSSLRVTPEVTFTIDLPNAWREVRGVIQLRTAANPQEWSSTDFAALTARRTDLMLPNPMSRVHTLRLRLPAGRTVNVPEDTVLEHANVRALVTAKLEGNELVIRREWHLLGGVVAPAEYPTFRRVLTGFDEAEDRQLRLVRE